MTKDYRQYPSSKARGKHASAKHAPKNSPKSGSNSSQAHSSSPNTSQKNKSSILEKKVSSRPKRAKSFSKNREQQSKQYSPQSCNQTKREAARASQSSYQRGERFHNQPQALADKKKRSPRKHRGPRRGLWRVVFWLSLAVFVVSVGALAAIGWSYWQGQNTYEKVAEQGFIPPSDIELEPLDSLVVDWDALYAINPDTIGWIYIPGTNINYPVVYADNNETYLYRSFTGESDGITNFGSIFLAAENKSDFSDVNNIIYGHHMNNGSMFSAVSKMDNPDAFNASRSIYLFTPQGNYHLTTFSILHCSADEPIAQVSFESEEARVSYLQDKIDKSVVPAQDIIPAQDMTKTFALSTCDNLPTDGRYVLFGYVTESTDSSLANTGTSDGNEAVDAAVKEITS